MVNSVVAPICCHLQMLILFWEWFENHFLIIRHFFGNLNQNNRFIKLQPYKTASVKGAKTVARQEAIRKLNVYTKNLFILLRISANLWVWVTARVCYSPATGMNSNILARISNGIVDTNWDMIFAKVDISSANLFGNNKHCWSFP